MIKKKIYLSFFNIFYFSFTIWTLIPTLSNVNLPLDTIEALAWGSNLDWGFNKHPPLSAFSRNFFQIFGNQDWAYYFLSQIFVIIAFFQFINFQKNFLIIKSFAFYQCYY